MVKAHKTEPLDTLKIVDRLNGLRAIVECAELAVSGLALDFRQKNAVTWVLLQAVDGLDELAEEIHPSPDEPEEAEEEAND